MIPTITHHTWPDEVCIWTMESPVLTEPIFFVSAQQASDYLFSNGLSAKWTTLNHD